MTKEQLKVMAKMLHEKRKYEGYNSSIARCHEIIARQLGYNSYNHFLQDIKKCNQ